MMTSTELAEILQKSEIPTALAVGFRTDAYFDAIRGLVDIFASKRGLNTIYITASMPSNSIIGILNLLEINMEKVHFVDCVSHIMMGAATRQENVHYVESPTMLENIMLKVEYLVRKNNGKNCLVILDAINSLAIHNNTKILSEFLHIFINSLRSKGVFAFIFSMEEFSSDEILGMMSLVCEDVISMSGRVEDAGT
ncbi:MAG: hypothetical protein AB1665_01480 [Candidatus Thermoplasmatota archaeon]